MISLSQLHRNSIATEHWLDGEAKDKPDRLIGYTATLMPLLEQLCALAEDIRQSGHARIGNIAYGSGDDASLSLSTTRGSTMTQRYTDLRNNIQAWRPAMGHGVSATSSRRLLIQAYSYRAAALLYQYRLLHPAGLSEELDREAFGMACEIMMHLNGPAEDLRLATWPAFIASCELRSEEDRAAVLNVFDGIYNVRRTGTSLQTKRFVTERVWKARDTHEDWDWMTLSRKHLGECIPI